MYNGFESFEAFEEHRLGAYRESVDYFAMGALACGYDFRDETQYHMQNAFELMARVDSVLDRGTKLEQQAIPEFLDTFLVGNGELTNTAPDCLDPELIALADKVRSTMSDVQSNQFGEKGRQLIDMNDEIKTTGSVLRYIKLAKKVGKLSGSMLLDVIPEVEKSDPAYKTFEVFVQRLASAGIYADWAIDMRQDFDEGLITVKPTLINQGLLGALSLPDVTRAVRSLGPNCFKLAGLAAHMAKRVIRSMVGLANTGA